MTTTRELMYTAIDEAIVKITMAEVERYDALPGKRDYAAYKKRFEAIEALRRDSRQAAELATQNDPRG